MSREQPAPEASPRSYYGRPVLKAPVWTWEVPTYFFCGGLAGASAGLAWLAERRGDEELARWAWAIALAGAAASPPLLISDLGRPERFANMLRLVKPTSPMSVGSWLLAAFGPSTAVAALNAWTGRLPRAAAAAQPAAAALGMPLATYTAALLSTTSVPVWHEARRTLPFAFAAGAAASAGAAAVAVAPPRCAAPARRLALGAAAAELVATATMERTLGDLGRPYRHGTAGRLGRASRALTVAGGAMLAAGGPREHSMPAVGGRRTPSMPTARARHGRSLSAAGAALIGAGALLARWSVFRAGFQSAADPAYVVGPQRARLAATRA